MNISPLSVFITLMSTILIIIVLYFAIKSIIEKVQLKRFSKKSKKISEEREEKLNTRIIIYKKRFKDCLEEFLQEKVNSFENLHTRKLKSGSKVKFNTFSNYSNKWFGNLDLYKSLNEFNNTFIVKKVSTDISEMREAIENKFEDIIIDLPYSLNIKEFNESLRDKFKSISLNYEPVYCVLLDSKIKYSLPEDFFIDIDSDIYRDYDEYIILKNKLKNLNSEVENKKRSLINYFKFN